MYIVGGENIWGKKAVEEGKRMRDLKDKGKKLEFRALKDRKPSKRFEEVVDGSKETEE